MITEKIKYIGVNDHGIDLFEGQYRVPRGMAYNSYLITDEKIAVMDGVEIGFADRWLENIRSAAGGRRPDYLIISHMEPDHSSSIKRFASAYPEAIIVSSAKAFLMMKGFFGCAFEDRRIIIGDGDELSLGERRLRFISAPMVHWPEVIMTYDPTDKILFTADAFGKFGALDIEDEWDPEAGRYYFGIVSKYGAQVQAVLKKAASLEIEAICPLHGPVLKGDLGHYFNLYDIWSSYRAEREGVCIAYASIYGNTRAAAELLEAELCARGVTVALFDLARCDMHKAIESAFRYDRTVLASSTYNCDIFPCMRSFLHGLVERNYQNRRVAFIENGSWSPMATRVMKSMLEKSKNLSYAKTEVKLISALNSESVAQIFALAEEFS